MKLWKAEITEQENILKRICHNISDASNQMDVDITVPTTEISDNIITDKSHTMQKNTVPGSEVYFGPLSPMQSRDQMLKSIIAKETLNAKQVI
jgi:hypothetical protein